MRKPVRQPASVRHCLFDTAIGVCGIAWSDGGVRRLQLPEADRSATERRLQAWSGSAGLQPPASRLGSLIENLQSYFAGERIDFSAVTLDLTGVGPFYHAIYAAARCIGWGRTATYGELARMVGSPHAARAVGQALGRNPIAIIVPCHRILASGGRPGGFSAFGGVITKERLLALEGVSLGSETPLLPGLLPARGR
ncbi:MAG: methylated-DNA--[protein]-cysteine S-methyltransferase [Hyphomicrobiaceae bacterium]|nr:MAG: methylated-DNA--[protein]-cysteine S-methyltransferase [Hyphomicrobiaceae bacterium]